MTSRLSCLRWFALVALVSGCADAAGDAAPGGLTGPCLADACFDGLQCVSDVCVDLDPDGSGSAASDDDGPGPGSATDGMTSAGGSTDDPGLTTVTATSTTGDPTTGPDPTATTGTTTGDPTTSTTGDPTGTSTGTSTTGDPTTTSTSTSTTGGGGVCDPEAGDTPCASCVKNLCCNALEACVLDGNAVMGCFCFQQCARQPGADFLVCANTCGVDLLAAGTPSAVLAACGLGNCAVCQ